MNTELESMEMSSGNVFQDLGLDDADDLLARAELVFALKKIIKDKGFTQRKTAAICGTDQPTLCKVLRGRLDLVSTDKLFAWLHRLGKQITVTIEDATPNQGSFLHVCCA